MSEASTFMPVELATRGGGENNSSGRDVAVCVQAVYGHVDVRRLVEWIEMQRLLGVSLVGVYATPSTHPDTRRTLERYAAAAASTTTSLVMELRSIDHVDGGSGYGHRLIVGLAAINDCIYRHADSHRFVAVIDFDEVSRANWAFARYDCGTDRSVRPRLRPTVCQTSRTDRSDRL